tara:strand:+ start:219110 stop:219355 length:246 start_codon:yes stop_codon:yes gene_type:complete
MAKLKVFYGSKDGVNNFMVAATSKPKAMAAMRIPKRLFDKYFSVRDDRFEENEIALAKPDTVFKQKMSVEYGVTHPWVEEK